MSSPFPRAPLSPAHPGDDDFDRARRALAVGHLWLLEEALRAFPFARPPPCPLGSDLADIEDGLLIDLPGGGDALLIGVVESLRSVGMDLGGLRSDNAQRAVLAEQSLAASAEGLDVRGALAALQSACLGLAHCAPAAWAPPFPSSDSQPETPRDALGLGRHWGAHALAREAEAALAYNPSMAPPAFPAADRLRAPVSADDFRQRQAEIEQEFLRICSARCVGAMFLIEEALAAFPFISGVERPVGNGRGRAMIDTPQGEAIPTITALMSGHALRLGISSPVASIQKAHDALSHALALLAESHPRAMLQPAQIRRGNFDAPARGPTAIALAGQWGLDWLAVELEKSVLAAQASLAPTAGRPRAL